MQTKKTHKKSTHTHKNSKQNKTTYIKIFLKLINLKIKKQNQETKIQLHSVLR